jgi:hypothetical protein
MQKKKILTAALASTLAATVIAGAGTFAYLQANTGTITNKFGKNAEEGLDITLTETDVTLDNEGNGEKIYEIKPNQQDDKDPTVTVTNNIDVFTFVEISDKTTLDNNKIVNYLVDEGWTKMTDELADDELVNDEVTDVYYRIVAADADNKEFPVIKDNEITYAQNVTGDKIDNDDVTIAFQAFCIDKAPFVEDGKQEIVSAADAYKAIPRVLAYEPEGNFTTAAVDEDTVAVTGYTGTNTEINIPRTIDGKTVVEIANNAFESKTTVTKVVVPSTVTEIGVAAFQSTPNLKEVRLSKNLNELSDEAFFNSGLESIKIPAGVDSITDSCFENCPLLETVTFSKGLKTLGENAFKSCISLKTVVLPDGLESLGGSTFVGCINLESVTIPASCTTFVDDEIFKDCDLTKLTIKGEAGSAAQTYAENNGITFEAI